MSLLTKILGRRAVAFAKVPPPTPARPPAPDVAELAAALLAEPGSWFAVTSVLGGDREAMAAVLAALEGAVGRQVKLWTPKGRGSYAVTLAATGEPWRTL